MRKKILCIIITMCLLVTLLPSQASAAAADLIVGRANINLYDLDDTAYYIEDTSGSSDFVTGGDENNYKFSVSEAGEYEYLLTLNGVDITETSIWASAGILCYGTLNINLAEGSINTIDLSNDPDKSGIIVGGSINITGSGTLNIIVDGGSGSIDDSVFGICNIGNDNFISIGDNAKVNITKLGQYGGGVNSEYDIRIEGSSQVKIFSWGNRGLFSENGNVAIGDNANVDISSKGVGIYSDLNTYIGYVWDESANNGSGAYVTSPVGSSANVKINNPDSINAITPLIDSDFITGTHGIYVQSGCLYVSESTLDITAGSDEYRSTSYGIYAQTPDDYVPDSYHVADSVVIYKSDVSINKYGNRGDGIYSNYDIRIYGHSDVKVIDWSITDGNKCGLHSYWGNIAIGNNASVDICSQNIGINAGKSAYFGYILNPDGDSYVESGRPVVKINSALSVSSITPDIAYDFEIGETGIYVWDNVYIAHGLFEATGADYAISVRSGNAPTNGTYVISSSTTPSIRAAANGSNTVNELASITWDSIDGKAYKFGTDAITHMIISSVYSVSKSTVVYGSFTVTADGDPTDIAEPGETITMSASPNRGYSFSAWRVFNTDDPSEIVPVTDNTFTMPGYDVTVEAFFVRNSSGSGGYGTSKTEKTITVAEVSSGLFKNSKGTIRVKANMDNAFSDSVEIKVSDTKEDSSGFGLGVGKEVYPFDISLYIKGTDEKTQPADGYAVTIYLPIPDSLLDMKENLSIAHKGSDGVVTTLISHLEQLDGVWYLVFEASEFSPYALVLDKTSKYDEKNGLPYFIDSDGNKTFIGFAANGKYLAPDGVAVQFEDNSKVFTDTVGHWAESYIEFVTEREIFVGMEKDTFAPNSGMTRAMFAAVLGRLYERSFGAIDSSAAQVFTDCDYSLWYGKYVTWASENGIITGYGNGLFKPNDMITREQMATLLYRFADYIKALPANGNAKLSYPDESTIASWAKSAALYCQQTGIISGRSGGVFAPKETATRAEVAVIIERFVELTLK